MLIPNIYPVTCHTDHVGQGSTFVAIKGIKENGALYIATALEKGASTIVVDQTDCTEALEALCSQHSAQLVTTTDTRKELALRASAALDNPAGKLKIIGITGTKGKTSTTYIIEYILRDAGFKTALIGTIKNKILDNELASDRTTPSSDYLQMFFHACVQAGVQYVVMEVSSHALSLDRVHGVTFAAAGFTNLAAEHMDFYATLDDYFAAKALLLDMVAPNGPIVINTDNAWGLKACQLSAQKNVVGFSLGTVSENETTNKSVRGEEPSPSFMPFDRAQDRNSRHSQGSLLTTNDLGNGVSNHPDSLIITTPLYPCKQFTVQIIQNTLEGLKIVIRRHDEDAFHGTTLSTPKLFGQFNVYNIAMAYLVCSSLGLPTQVVREALSFFPGIPGRLQLHILKNGARAFVDYAHNPSSFNEVLSTLRVLSHHLIVVFGCGGDRDTTKRPVMGELAARYADKVIVTDDNPRSEPSEKIINEILGGIPESRRSIVITQADRRKAIKNACQLSNKDSVIAILGKGHEHYYIANGKTMFFDDFEEIRTF